MRKNEKITTPVSVSAAASPVYLLGTYNQDKTPFFATVTFVCYIPGSPECQIVGIASSEQTKENINREQVFSLNLCTVDMKDLADDAWLGYAPDKSEKHIVDYCNGNKLDVPILNASPNNIECKVTQSLQIGHAAVFVSEVLCQQADSRLVPPYPGADGSYKWYESIDAKKFNPLLYGFNYYTLSESLGQIGMKW